MLYSYCIRYDDGAAPNPYHGFCTLVICKPAIRRTANSGDWIVGLGGIHSPIGDISGHVVYAMRISKKLSMRDYDTFCHRRLRGKIPRWRSKDFVKRVGDCIYDFSITGQPAVRPSVHSEHNRKVDLSGKNALLSNHFYYFGDHPVRLPRFLQPIVHQTQGHKAQANAEYVDRFAAWIGGLGFASNEPHGEPQLKTEVMEVWPRTKCSVRDREDDEHDEIC